MVTILVSAGGETDVNLTDRYHFAKASNGPNTNGSAQFIDEYDCAEYGGSWCSSRAVFNERTRRVVSGHQRLTIQINSLEVHYDEYRI